MKCLCIACGEEFDGELDGKGLDFCTDLCQLMLGEDECQNDVWEAICYG